MSTPAEDGGPAFPHYTKQVAPDVVQQISKGGMSLRDYFAGQALQSLLLDTRQPLFSQVAEMAYEQADYMLAARKTK